MGVLFFVRLVSVIDERVIDFYRNYLIVVYRLI